MWKITQTKDFYQPRSARVFLLSRVFLIPHVCSDFQFEKWNPPLQTQQVILFFFIWQMNHSKHNTYAVSKVCHFFISKYRYPIIKMEIVTIMCSLGLKLASRNLYAAGQFFVHFHDFNLQLHRDKMSSLPLIENKTWTKFFHLLQLHLLSYEPNSLYFSGSFFLCDGGGSTIVVHLVFVRMQEVIAQ